MLTLVLNVNEQVFQAPNLPAQFDLWRHYVRILLYMVSQPEVCMYKAEVLEDQEPTFSRQIIKDSIFCASRMRSSARREKWGKAIPRPPPCA